MNKNTVYRFFLLHVGIIDLVHGFDAKYKSGIRGLPDHFCALQYFKYLLFQFWKCDTDLLLFFCYSATPIA